MMAKLFIFLLLSFSIATAQSQAFWCGSRSDGNDNSIPSIDPTQLNNYLNAKPIQSRSEKAIQVVVHIVTDDPFQFSYGEVLHQIDILNADFANRSENISKLNSEFLELTGDT